MEIHKKVEKYLDKLVKYKFLDKKVRWNGLRNNFTDPRIKGLVNTLKYSFPLLMV